MPSYSPKNFTVSASLTLSDAETLLTVNAAAGLTLTLPAAAGTGACYKIFIGTTVTSNSVAIKVANASDSMVGVCVSAADGGATVNGWEVAANDDTITLNGSTTGGIKGDYIELTDAATNLWRVNAWTASTGMETTPFSNTVS